MRSVRTLDYNYIINFEETVPEQCCTDVNHGALFAEQEPILNRLPNPPEELYDLRTDPGELHNLAEDPNYAEIKQELAQVLAKELVRTKDPILDGLIETPTFTSKRQAVRALAGT